MVALLAVLEAGAAAVLLPPSYPESRRRDILAFAGLDAVIDHPDSPLDALLAGDVAAELNRLL